MGDRRRTPARYGEWSKMGVKRREKPPNGGKPKNQKGVTRRGQVTRTLGGSQRRAVCSRTNLRNPGGDPRAGSLAVQRRTKHGDEEMCKMRSAVVHLQPPHNTMIGEVFGHAGFGNAEMFRQLRLDGCLPAACGATPQ